MKKLISLLLIIIIISIAVVSCNLNNILREQKTSATSVISNTDSPSQEIEWEEKIYWEGDLNANFVIGELMVILDKAISEPQKIHHPDFFVGVEVVKIYDCSTPIKDPDNIPEGYRQILHLTLSDKYDTKEKTFEAMRILENVPGIVSVSPNLILSYDVAPNDPFFDNSIGFHDQWGHEKIEVEKVWGFATSSSDVRGGVIDT